LISDNKMVQLIADACLEEKAIDMVALDVNKLTVVADYFVIASGRNMMQVKSIVDHVEEKLRDYDIIPARREGHTQGVWVVLDFNSVILHVFREEERDYYNLENLWGDAREIAIVGND